MIISRRSGLVVGLILLGLVDRSASAQFGRRQPTPNDTLKSTEVSADHKVTFRIYAPKADDVSVSGDFGQGGKMTRDDKGVWSIEVGPITPDFYSYTFNVDGVRTVDPKNPMIKQGVSGLDSMFLVPGPEAEFELTKDVPHGEVRVAWYSSATLGSQRRLHIYTPPGYEKGDAKYPVLYLLHGAGDEDSGWSTIGRAGFIIDNLIAANKAVPMIVVMPNGSLPTPTGLPPRPKPGSAPSTEFRAAMEKMQNLTRLPGSVQDLTTEFRAAMEKMQNRFTDELLKEIIPFVESTYRAKAGPDNRALAGLSMGGMQTLRVVATNPDKFTHVAIWSSGLFNANPDEWEKQNESFLAAADKINDSVKLFEITVGDKDFALAGSKSLAGVLEKRKVKHAVQITGGGHTWTNWRHYLNELAPKLFR